LGGLRIQHQNIRPPKQAVGIVRIPTRRFQQILYF